MNSDREPVIPMYLRDLILELEQKLENPKNSWKRQEDLKEQIADAEKRLSFVTRKRRSSGRTSSGDRSGQARSQRPMSKAQVISYR